MGGLRQTEAWANDYNTTKAGDRPVELRRAVLTSDGDDPFEAGLKGCNRPAVVLFVAVHGSADATHGAYLIPNDADPHNNAYTSYPLARALAALKNLPAKTKKLLIL